MIGIYIKCDFHLLFYIGFSEIIINYYNFIQFWLHCKLGNELICHKYLSCLI